MAGGRNVALEYRWAEGHLVEALAERGGIIG
jgi:hypothetical protein